MGVIDSLTLGSVNRIIITSCTLRPNTEGFKGYLDLVSTWEDGVGMGGKAQQCRRNRSTAGI